MSDAWNHAVVVDPREADVGSVLGFGFAPFDGRWVKIPQTGRVVIAGTADDITSDDAIRRSYLGY